MADVTRFRGVLDFFKDIGVYDVVLPFLLVFTIVFAIFEKTKVFGVEKIAGEDYTKKNLNAMTAFVIAFLVVASTKLVAVINEALANIVLLMLIGVFFLVLVGVFYKDGQFELDGSWKTFFMIFMFVGILFIFLYAIKMTSNVTYCNDYTTGECPVIVHVWGYLHDYWDTNVVGSLILIIFIIGFMYFVTKNPEEKKEKKESK